MKQFTTAVVGVVLASPVLAHPGHDTALQGAAHYVFSPLHGLGVIGVACLAALAVRRYREGTRNE